MPTFEDMEELAKDGSTESRRQLLRLLTDLFLENLDQTTGAQGEAFGDIVNRVLDDVVEEAREEFSTRIATADMFPKDVVKRLAWDAFEVAAPILEHSTVLSDSDLVEVAHEKSNDHLMAISRRPELHEKVTDVLIERGEEDVIHSVATNHGAQFSPKGYGTLASKAKGDEALQRAIVERRDVTADVAARLEPSLSAELKKRLAEALDETNNDVANLVARARERVEQAMAGKKRDRVDVEKLVAEVAEGTVTLDDAARSLAAEDRPLPLSVLIATVAELPEKMISNAMLKVNGMPIAITCRALKVEAETFAAITQMRCRVLRLPGSAGERLAEQYSSLDQGDAERTLRFLRVRKSLSENAA
ncbi:DUF2336 domain-containing protein [Mariluticola halotolerans]|uniref:DUF2336 domain-containing protein n=1 Tax=Mariluticola halotolerans TaxID=2909283 RepID=UPI0026E1541F|nr:DUF2336 domain-containing protein [Mariluticola halotolerans]UJQ95680.1 DUF2336 domain-containing protein [Mariluticola halotolerans]